MRAAGIMARTASARPPCSPVFAPARGFAGVPHGEPSAEPQVPAATRQTQPILADSCRTPAAPGPRTRGASACGSSVLFSVPTQGPVCRGSVRGRADWAGCSDALGAPAPTSPPFPGPSLVCRGDAMGREASRSAGYSTSPRDVSVHCLWIS